MRAFPLILFIAIIAIISGGCSENDEIRAVLESAQACMETRPDSALAMLSVVDRSDADEDLKARHAVLLTEAQYMSRQCPPSDSLIASASQYYDRHMSDPQRMRAYYYRGRVLISLEEYGDAVISLLNAAHTAKILDNHLWLGLIYRGIADSFDALIDNSSALEYYDLSYKEFAKAPVNKYTDFALCDLARASFNAQKYDQSMEHAQSAYMISDSTGNEFVRAMALTFIRKVYCKRSDFQNAKIAFEEQLALGPQCIEPKDWWDAGLMYVSLGDMEKAIRINDSVAKYLPGENFLTLAIYRRDGKYKEAYELLCNELKEQNDVMSQIMHRNFAKIIKDYYDNRLNSATEELKSEKSLKLLWVILSLIILLISVALLLYRDRLLKQKMSRYIDMAQSLKATLYEKSNTISQLESIQKDNQQQMVRLSASQNRAKYDARQSIQRILSSKFDILDQLCVTYYETQGKTYEKKRIYEKVIELIDGIRNDSDIARNLENAVNESMDRLIQRFRDDFPALNESDVQLFTLYVLGFSPRAISIMQGISINNVYTRKSNLKKSIEKSMVENAEEYLSFLS